MTPHERAEVQPEPKRVRASIKAGLCVYRLVEDASADPGLPHEIVAHWLADVNTEQLRLKPLGAIAGCAPSTETVEAPLDQTAPLAERFRSAWETHGCDVRTTANRGIYDAHILAVKRQARATRMHERVLFNQLRWGAGNLALKPTPPSLEEFPADDGDCF